MPAHATQSEIVRKQKVAGLNRSQLRDGTRDPQEEQINSQPFSFRLFLFFDKVVFLKNIHSHYDTLEITTRFVLMIGWGMLLEDRCDLSQHQAFKLLGVCLGVSKG